jgi:hypothetical protein
MLSLIKPLSALILCLSLVSASPLARRNTPGVQTNCKKGYFALTYDDGPYEYTSELVDKLNAAGVKVGRFELCYRQYSMKFKRVIFNQATFFVNGNNWWYGIFLTFIYILLFETKLINILIDNRNIKTDSSAGAAIKKAYESGHQVRNWARKGPFPKPLIFFFKN